MMKRRNMWKRNLIGFIMAIFSLMFVAATTAWGGQNRLGKNVVLNSNHFAPLSWYASKGYTASANYKKVVDVTFVDISLEKALKKIARKGHLRLSYGQKELVDGHRVMLIRHNVTIIEAIEDVLQGTGLKAVASPDGQVVIRKVKKESMSAFKLVQETVSGTVTDA
jgi:hypothetical protein